MKFIEAQLQLTVAEEKKLTAAKDVLCGIENVLNRNNITDGEVSDSVLEGLFYLCNVIDRIEDNRIILEQP